MKTPCPTGSNGSGLWQWRSNKLLTIGSSNSHKGASSLSKSVKPAFSRWICSLFCFALVGCGSTTKTTSNGNPSYGSTPKAAIAEQWTPPSGFTRYDSTVAWRWLDGSERQCPNNSRCIQVEVITKDGCPSMLYAKASITDQQNRNLGYTNDTTSGLQPDQRAILSMPDTTGGAAEISANLDEIKCI